MRYLFPFLAPPEAHPNAAGGPGAGTAVQMSGVTRADAVSTSPRVEKPSIEPTRNELPTELGGKAVSAAAEGGGDQGAPSPSTEVTDDLSALSPSELLTKYRELEKAHKSLSETAPDKAALEELRLESSAWRRLVRSPEFERFVNSLNEEGEASSGKAPSSDIMSLEDIEDLSPESRQKLQAFVDRYVSSKIQPLQEEWIREKTQKQLAELSSKYGEDWSRLIDPKLEMNVQKLMREQGMEAETAFLVLRAQELMAEKQSGKFRTAQEKILAADASSGGNGNLRNLAPIASTPKTLAEAFAMAEQEFDRRA
jgi:hypothetical protein